MATKEEVLLYIQECDQLSELEELETEVGARIGELTEDESEGEEE